LEQIYDPLSNQWLSSLVAAISIIFFFVALAAFRLKGYVASTITVALALLLAGTGIAFPFFSHFLV
jgi:L-lactate permease